MVKGDCLNPLMAVATAALVVASSAASGQYSPACYPQSQLDAMRNKLLAQQQDVQAAAQEYTQLLKRKSVLLAEHQNCMSGRSALDDLGDALALQDSPCNRIVVAHNNVNERAQTVAALVSALQAGVEAGLTVYRSAQAQRCPSQ